MEIKRDVYLNKLIFKKHNGLVKVVTGVSQRMLWLRCIMRTGCWS